jgi:N-sulfoglucosamine sulfohydrolase
MKRRDFLKTVACGSAAAVLSGCTTGADPKKSARRGFLREATPRKDLPNILWLISEDTCPDLACYGHSQVKTPNLDKLAGEGARFTNAFVTAPVCSPSRSAFMTGMYQTSIGAHHHRSHRNDSHILPMRVMLLTEYFRRAGYFRCNCAGLNYKQPGKTDWNFMTMAHPFDGTDWSQRRTGQPFFAQVNFSLTHRNFRRDKKNPIDPEQVELPPYYPDHPLARRDWADYLESIQLLDTEIGVALRWLETEGVAENTIVMYFADNGRPHVRGKQWLYEGGIHVPVMIRWPGHLRPGTVVDDLVSAVDFGPTFLSLAGLAVPPNMQGRVWVNGGKKGQKYVFAARDRCDGTPDRIRCVRSAQYKYIRNYHPEQPYTQFNAYKKLQYPVLTLMEVLHQQGRLTPEQERFMAPTRPKEELYDLQADPHELHNLAEDPQAAKILKEHRKKLDEWIRKTEDEGETPEDPQVFAAARDEMLASYQLQMADRGLSPDISNEEYLKWWEKRLLG